MSVHTAIMASGSTYAAYRYHDGELIWARASFTGGIMYGDWRGYVNGQPVHPSPEKYMHKMDWQPWKKLQGLPALRPPKEGAEER